MREALSSIRAEIGSPPMFSKEPVREVPNTEIAGTGLVFFELLGWRPAVEPVLMNADAVAVVREILGEGARIELVGGVMTDESRPFFEWHNHVGGPDDEAIRQRGGVGQSATRPQRLSYLIYLDDVTETDGPMLVLPGRPADSFNPPEPPERPRWSGDVVVTYPAGSVLLIDETTWHAVPQRTTPGLRRWVGAYFAAGHLPPSERVDSSLAHVRDPLVRSLVAR
jgi:hypothetical protein